MASHGAAAATVPGAAAASPTTASAKLAGKHFAAAIAYLVSGSVGLVWIAPELAAGNYLAPHVTGVAHLFTLGWLTMTIFGALYQLVPVALGAPLRWPRMAHVSFAALAPGAGAFACGVAAGSVWATHAGIALLTLGIVLAVTNLAATLPRARSRDETWVAIALAMAFLVSTLILGVVLLHNVHTGFIAAARVRVLATHLHMAIVGWALMMIVGVSHRLLPMFLLAHGADTRWTRRAIVLLAAGVTAFALGTTLSLPALVWVAVVLLEAGVACFVRQAWAFYRVRVRKQIDVGMRFAATALAFLAAAGVLGPILLVRGASSTRVATAYVLAGLLGGVVTYVIGFLYKIIPLLAWTVRYQGMVGQASAPTVAQLYSARTAQVQLALMGAGLVALITATLLGLATVAVSGAALYFTGALIFASQMLRVAVGRPIGVTS
ncbi:MAG: hypothetical protein IT361_02975 [Gemmatimonadaceae bacterium]|nr:hypothetical protein [Gemmatimonadaceae bacterium]